MYAALADESSLAQLDLYTSLMSLPKLHDADADPNTETAPDGDELRAPTPLGAPTGRKGKGRVAKALSGKEMARNKKREAVLEKGRKRDAGTEGLDDEFPLEAEARQMKKPKPDEEIDSIMTDA
jgi:hypothetical protein